MVNTMRQPYRQSWTRALIIALFFGAMTGAGGAAAAPELRADAPERHVVVPGDTLWSLASRFLKDPWRWPELWRMNREQIANPHLLRPGDVLVLSRTPRPSVQLVKLESVKLAPQARVESREAEAIPTIPPSAIEPFLSRPLAAEAAQFERAPIIVATEENRVIAGAGNKVYVKGLSSAQGTAWQVFRPSAKPLTDPDNGEVLGYEGFFLGEARVTQFGDPSTAEILKSTQEIRVGDRLLPLPRTLFPTYVPHAPERPVKGRLISTYGRVGEVGKNDIVALNKGSRDGLEAGHVLALLRDPAMNRDVVRRGATPVEALPVERYGLVMVFRTFDRVSYALVMQASLPVNLSDWAQTP